MNQPPQHLDDESLSAHVDGALGDAAASADRHLAGCDACAGRLVDLRAARAAVATPVPPLDDLSRQRLTRRALEADSWDRARIARAPRWLAAAAAAAMAVGVVGFFAARDGGGGDLTAAPEGAGIGDLPLGAEFIALDVGALDDPEQMRAALEATEYGSPAQAGGGAQVISGGGSSGSSDGGASGTFEDEATSDHGSAPAAGAGSSSQTDPIGSEAPAPAAPTEVREAPSGIRALPPPTTAPAERYADVARCYAALAGQLPDGRLTVAVTGRFGDRDVVVMGFRTTDGRRLLAVVLDRNDCAILTAQSFR